MAKKNINQLIKQAEAGNVESMYKLAICYRDGDDTKQDFEKFTDWLTRLRKRHGFIAKIKAILSFQDRPESELRNFVQWVQASAVSGSATGCQYLATLYREGVGVKKDLGQYIEWLNKAITAGDVISMGNLAAAYRKGLGVEKDLDQSTTTFIKRGLNSA